MSDWNEDSLREAIAAVISSQPRDSFDADIAAAEIIKLFETGCCSIYSVLGLLNGDLTACDGYCHEDA